MPSLSDERRGEGAAVGEVGGGEADEKETVFAAIWGERRDEKDVGESASGRGHSADGTRAPSCSVAADQLARLHRYPCQFESLTTE